MARLGGFEPTTSASAGLRSIQLSYKRVFSKVPKEGFEPTRPLQTLRPERSASTISPLRHFTHSQKWAILDLNQ